MALAPHAINKLQSVPKMIQLSLQNFRCHADKTITLSSDFALISGPSGAGKTSIFMAIHFALTGEGKKIVLVGKRTCKVVLQIDGITITRTKCPCRVLFQARNGVQLEDNEAEAAIQTEFPFWELGYVSQRVYKSFLASTPAEKAEFINRVAFGSGLDILALQTRSKELVVERREALNKITAERTMTKQLIESIGNVDNDDGENLPTNDDDELAETCKAECDAIANLTERICVLKHRIDAGVKRLDAIARDTSAKMRLQTMLSETDDDTMQMVDIDRLQKENADFELFALRRRALDQLPRSSGLDMNELEQQLIDAKRVAEIVPKVSNLAEMRRRLAHLDQQRRQCAVMLRCPACSTNLGLRGTTLEIATGDVTSVTPREVEKQDIEHAKLVAGIEVLDQLEKELENLLDGKTINNPSSIESQMRIDIKRRELEVECANLECDKPAMTVKAAADQNCKLSERRKMRAELAAIENRLMQNDLTWNDVERDRNACAEMENNVRRIEDCQIKADAERRERARLIEQRKMLERIREQKRLHIAREKALVDLEAIAEKDLPRAIKLQGLIKQAERVAIEQTIETINSRAEQYLERFFADRSVKVALVIEKNKIDVDVTVDGCQSDLTSLSGGEFARATLAFAIAVAEVNGVSLLMLDESFASLDADTTETVISALKELHVGMVVVIAHQTTTGVFDCVIEL